MIRVLGGPKRLCDGVTRRDLLQVGSLSLLGLGLGANTGRAAVVNESAAPVVYGKFGQAKSCIFLFLYGSPSQLETFDPKPDAPEQIRGELKSIPSNVPGLDVCELLPHMAGVMDKVTVLRSVSHPFPLHGVAYATTGLVGLSAPQELSPRDPGHWPYIGSVIDYVDTARATGKHETRREVPRNLVLPWAFSSQRIGEVARAGPYGGFLGQAWDPVSTEFVGKATTKARKTLQEKVWEDLEPYRGITPGEPLPPRRGVRPPEWPDARPPRSPSDVARTDRGHSPRAGLLDDHPGSRSSARAGIYLIWLRHVPPRLRSRR